MAVKYEIEYYDVVNILHKCLIYDDAYIGDLIEIQGSVFLEYTSIDNNLEVIRAQGLRVELEANTDLTYSDLYSEDEKSFQVEYYRDSELLFKGWLNPEGWYEDFVTDNWVVSFDCVDGLGYLQNLSFVESNGLPIRGKITQSEALFKALARTGIDKYMNVAIGIYYTGLTAGVPILDNVYVIADRYIKDDGETIMSCEEVIKDILEPYGAVLTSLGDSWYIYKPNELYLNNNKIFNKYNTSGVAYQSVVKDFTREIGSNVNNFTIHHCSENQRLSVKPSIGAYRISYKYGLVRSFFENTFLCSDDGSTIDNWNIISSTNLDPLVADECGVIIKTIGLTGEIEQIRTNDAQIDSTTLVQTIIKYDIERPVGNLTTVGFQYQLIVSDKVITDPTGIKYYLQDDLTWGAGGVVNTLRYVDLYQTNIIDLTTPVMPSAITGIGYFYVSIWTPAEYITQPSKIKVREVRVSPSQSNSGSTVDGEFHTFKRKTKPSAQVKEIIEVSTGDNITDLYVGTLYKTDATTPTETWYRNGFIEAKPILQIMGEEAMRISQLPTRVYQGNIFGYLDILSLITINNVAGKFMIIEYSLDTKSNITSLTLRQVLGDELTDLDYQKSIDYGNTVKPTIEG